MKLPHLRKKRKKKGKKRFELKTYNSTPPCAKLGITDCSVTAPERFHHSFPRVLDGEHHGVGHGNSRKLVIGRKLDLAQNFTASIPHELRAHEPVEYEKLTRQSSTTRQTAREIEGARSEAWVKPKTVAFCLDRRSLYL